MKQLIGVLAMLACVDCAGDPSGTTSGSASAMADATLYALVPADPTWKFYKNSATPIMRASIPHAESHALVRYNRRAATQARLKRTRADWRELSRFVHHCERAFKQWHPRT